MNTEFTEQDSLRIINQMIAQARNNFQRGSLNVVLFWGYFISFISIANFILLRTLPNPVQSFWVWTVALLGWIISYFMQRKVDRTAIVKTHIDTIVKFTWLGFGISSLMLVLIFWTMRLHHNAQFLYLTPIIMLMCGVAQFVTAIACRYKLYYWGAVAFWLGAFACAASVIIFKVIDYQFLILPIAMVISCVIPNHILNKKAKQNV